MFSIYKKASLKKENEIIRIPLNSRQHRNTVNALEPEANRAMLTTVDVLQNI